ncbi:Clavaminate synthase-like protein [Rhizodiscina lignyota]|uniref:Clavaminate synthase-like protein n=1 Tax=Rhizodiscina lignyota TaxID=1504668 RepID=A0A9P4IC80_9PEZI|nr:Clavaminate synthase-like protein [Rhizodiscina lignyota]
MSSAPVTVSLADLKRGSVPISSLVDAFGPSSLGILIVKDLPSRFLSLRESLLQYASYLARLPEAELDLLTSPETHYNVGWSHGKEKLKSGAYDTHKGSFYIGCRLRYASEDVAVSKTSALREQSVADQVQFHDYTAPSLWPAEELLPGFKAVFEELCDLIMEFASTVAKACDSFAMEHVEGYRGGFLEEVVKKSITHKARLLHYFPSESSSVNGSTNATASNGSREDDDDWCATHLDDGCLTALTSALYIDESGPLPPIMTSNGTPELKNLNTLSTPPDPQAGLYIASRTSSIVKVSIPPDCLAFQTGEALELITKGAFKAVPHYVRAPRECKGVARNTLALFMQPNLDVVVDEEKDLTFGEFVKEIAERNT